MKEVVIPSDPRLHMAKSSLRFGVGRVQCCDRRLMMERNIAFTSQCISAKKGFWLDSVPAMVVTVEKAVGGRAVQAAL